MDAGLRCELAAGTGSIVEIWGLDDWEQYCYVPGLYETGQDG